MARKLQFRIPEWASVEDVAEWDCDEGDEVEFRIKRESNFQLFATGTAIGALHRVRSKASHITIRSEFSLPKNSLSRGIHEWPSCFLTLGGIALLHAADSVLDSSEVDLSSMAFDMIWHHILKHRGVIGDGKRQNLVCREFDSPIPEAVRSSESHRIPSRKEFECLLAELGSDLGAGKRFFTSRTEAGVSSFLFEAFRNAIEHAQPDKEGIWGVMIEKLLLQAKDDITNRKQIPEIAKDFVTHQFQNRSGLWVCVTVLDYGLGIQKTLPALKDESEWKRLLRAFERGTSRKPQSGTPNRGQGLPNIIDEASRLKACIFVISSGLSALYDATKPQPEWSQIPIPAKLRGTSVSLFWPITDESPDQQILPF